MLTSLKAIPLKLWSYLLAGVVVLYLLYRVYKAGGDQKEVDNLNSALEAVRRRNTIEENTNALDDNAVSRKLRDSGWFRNE